MTENVIQVSGLSLIEVGSTVLSGLGIILFTMLTLVLLRRPLNKHQEKAVLFAAIAMWLYFVGNFMTLIPKVLVFGNDFIIQQVGWIITLVGICAIPSLFIHGYGSYYNDTRSMDNAFISKHQYKALFFLLHFVSLFFLVGFFIFASRPASLQTVDLNLFTERLLFESFGAWVFIAFIAVSAMSLKMSVMEHWVRFRYYFYLNGVLILLAALITAIGFWGLTIVSKQPQIIRFIFILIALAHGMMVGYYRVQYLFVSIFVSPSLLYFSLAGLVVAVYQFGIRNLMLFLSQYPTVNVEVIEIVLLLGLIFLLQPARVHIQARINNLLFQKSTNFQASIHSISQQLKSSTNLDTLLSGVSKQLAEFLGVNTVKVILTDTPDAENFSATHEFLRNAPEPILSYNMTSDVVADEFAVANYELMVAIREERELLLGMLAVSSKQLYKNFSNQDIHLITTVANQLAIYIKNVVLIEERVNMEKIMLTQENLSSLGQISANITHDIKNPLSAINTLVQVMQEEMPSGDNLKNSLVTIEKELEYLNLILSEIVKYSEPESGEQQLVAVDEVLHGVLVLLHSEARLKGVELVLHQSPVLHVSGTLQTVKKIFFNLIFNAIQACDDQPGKVEIWIKDSDGDIVVTISDTGVGLPLNNPEEIFEPYFTTKPNGVGLGLTITKESITKMGGSISVENRPKGGAKFMVRIPKAEKV